MSIDKINLHELLNRMIMDGAAINARDHKESRLIVDGVAMMTTKDVQESMKILRETLEDVIKTGDVRGMYFDVKIAQELKTILDNTTVSGLIIQMIKKEET